MPLECIAKTSTCHVLQQSKHTALIVLCHLREEATMQVVLIIQQKLLDASLTAQMSANKFILGVLSSAKSRKILQLPRHICTPTERSIFMLGAP